MLRLAGARPSKSLRIVELDEICIQAPPAALLHEATVEGDLRRFQFQVIRSRLLYCMDSVLSWLARAPAALARGIATSP